MILQWVILYLHLLCGLTLEASDLTPAVTTENIEVYPSTRTVFISNSRWTKFGFYPHNAITKCYFELNIDVSGSFDVMHKKYDEEFLIANQFLNQHGDQGLCQISLKPISKQVTSAVITASNGITNLTSVNFTILPYSTVPIHTTKINITRSENIIQFLTIQPFPSSQIYRCYLYFKNSRLFFDQSGKIIVMEADQEDLFSDILLLKNKTCGFTLQLNKPPHVYENHKWHLFLTSDDIPLMGNEFSVNVIELTIPAVDIYMKLGANLTLRCGHYISELCLLYTPRAELIAQTPTCSRNFILSHKEIGIWKCLLMSYASSFTLNVGMGVIEDKSGEVSSFWRKDQNHIVIGCTVELPKPIGFCRMVSPTGEVYNLNNNSVFTRYSGIETNFNDRICAIQIEAPLKSNEMGIWTCNIFINNDEYGTKISVGKPSMPAYKHLLTKIINPSQNFFIDCKVPYGSDNCYIQSPSGSIFFDEETYYPTLGRCLLNVPSTYHSKTGIWSCNFARLPGETDDTIFIKVRMKKARIKQFIEIRIGESVQITCAKQAPIYSCFFMSPNNISYHLVDNIISSSNVHYYGKGFENGECGMEILKTSPSHFGLWTCITKSSMRSKRLDSTAILLYPLETESIDIQSTDQPSRVTSLYNYLSYTVLIVTFILIQF